MRQNSKEHHVELLKAFEATFKTDQGQMVLAHLIKRFYVLNSTFGDGGDATAHREGSRHVVLYILENLHTGPDDLDRIYEQQRTGGLEWSKD